MMRKKKKGKTSNLVFVKKMKGKEVYFMNIFVRIETFLFKIFIFI
jgi:hypothetical protein